MSYWETSPLKQENLKLTNFWLLDNGETFEMSFKSDKPLYQAIFKFYSNHPPFKLHLQNFSTTYMTQDNLYCQEKEKNWITDRSCCKKDKKCWCELTDQLIWNPTETAETKVKFKDCPSFSLRIKMKINDDKGLNWKFSFEADIVSEYQSIYSSTYPYASTYPSVPTSNPKLPHRMRSNSDEFDAWSGGRHGYYPTKNESGLKYYNTLTNSYQDTPMTPTPTTLGKTNVIVETEFKGVKPNEEDDEIVQYY